MTTVEALRVLQDDPAPFFLTGGAAGVLLLHGFGGTPREMRPLGDYLSARGLTVNAPLVPGHGGTLALMNQHGWQDWVAGVESAYDQLTRRCEQVFVAGFSMGSLLALWLAENQPEMTAIVLYSPALQVANWRIHLAPLARHFLNSLAIQEESDLHDPQAEEWLGGFERYPVPAAAELLHLQRRVSRALQRVQAPALVVYSVGDRSIHPRSGPETVRRLSKWVPVESLVLQASGHAVIVDQEWESVAEATYRFIQRHTGAAE